MSWTRTAEPIDTLHLSSLRYCAMNFTSENGHAKYDLNPPYQRGSVWSTQQRRDLIRSLLMGVPIGAVITNKRTYSTERNIRIYGVPHIYAVVDGKQRVETIIAFANDELSVPAEWWEDRSLIAEKVTDDGFVTFSGLTDYGQRQFEMFPMPTEEAQVTGLAAEAAIFGLVNTSGTPQTDADIQRAEEIAS